MKHLTFASLLLAASVVTLPAYAATGSADSCTATASQLARKTREFVKLNADGRGVAQAASARPGDFYRSMGARDVALHAIASDVWTMRADMASRNCRQAADFSY